MTLITGWSTPGTLLTKAEFPWISSNLTTQGGSPISEDGTTFQSKSGDLNVGAVSLTADLDRTVAAKDVVVGNFVEVARGDVDRLRAQTWMQSARTYSKLTPPNSCAKAASMVG